MVGVPLAIFVTLIWAMTLVSIVWSFTDWNGTDPMHFVGLDNYTQLFTTYPFFWPAVAHNVMWLLFFIDWLAIFGYLAITILLGFWFRKRSAKSVDDYFVSGRNVNWWLAGTSMVATTFAADTPLVVTGLVYAQGISGNWLWWGSLLSGMMTVFLFARLWRRSGLLTDV